MKDRNRAQSINSINKAASFFCEACQSTQIDINICNSCNFLSCDACKKSHICQNNARKTFKLQTQIESDYYSSDFSQKIFQRTIKNKEKKKQFQKILELKNHSNILCQRCTKKPSQVKCLNCKINYLCKSCFQSIHSFPKLAFHQYQHTRQIQTIEQNSIYFTKIALSPKQRQQISMKCQPQLNLTQQGLLLLKANISLVKNTLCMEQAIQQNKINQLFCNITDIFSNLIEQIKQKIDQVTIRIKENEKSNILFWQEATFLLCKEDHNLHNLLLMKKLQNQFNISLKYMDNKKLMCEKSIKNWMSAFMAKKQQLLTDSLEQFNKETKLIQQKIQNIDIKRGFPKVNSPKNSTSHNSARNSNSRMKQSECLKSFFNRQANKSAKKSCILNAQLFASPKKSQRHSTQINQYTALNSLFYQERKIAKQQRFKQIKNIIHAKQGDKNHLDKNCFINCNKKSQIQNQLLSPKVSNKRFKENNQNSQYAQTEKERKYMQKQKRISQQINYEILQFSNRFIDLQKELKIQQLQFKIVQKIKQS